MGFWRSFVGLKFPCQDHPVHYYNECKHPDVCQIETEQRRFVPGELMLPKSPDFRYFPGCCFID